MLSTGAVETVKLCIGLSLLLANLYLQVVSCLVKRQLFLQLRTSNFPVHSILNQKDTQEKLGKLKFDLESPSNTNAIQKTIKQFTDIISECGELKREVRLIRNPKNLGIVRTVRY